MLGSAKRKAEIQVESIWIYAPWATPSTVSLAGYDVSGIAGTNISPDDVPTSSEVTLTPDTPTEKGWASLYLHDRAGNASHPVRIPLIFVEDDK